MFYPAFAAIPEWAPPAEDHILYSEGILRDVSYGVNSVQYTATDARGLEYLRLSFRPTMITANGAVLSLTADPKEEGYTLRGLGDADFAVTIRRTRSGRVQIR